MILRTGLEGRVCCRSQLLPDRECRTQPKTPSQMTLKSGHVEPDLSVTVVLNVFQRVENLGKQLASFAASTLKPTEIWVCMFASPKTQAFTQVIEIFKMKYPAIHVHAIVSSYNFKYFGRFQLAMQASTKYVALFDDDQIPGPTTLELLVNVAEKLKQPAILGLTGRVFVQPSTTHGCKCTISATAELTSACTQV